MKSCKVNWARKIIDIYNTGANDIYTVKTLEGKEVLLPAIKDVIKQVDIQNKKVIERVGSKRDGRWIVIK